MKKLLLSTAMLIIIGMTGVNGQSTLIISENFQKWAPTEDTDDTKCSAGVVHEYDITRMLRLVTTGDTVEIPVTLYKAGIAPECESRRIEDADPPGSIENLPGVTTGWVSLNKLNDATIDNFETSLDTIGEFIFGPVPQIDSIRFAHSTTGGGRGIRVYLSSDGVNWERASEDEFWDCADCQRGDVNSVEIMLTDVYIKFTSGFKASDGTSQYSRLHNIDVWGVPGTISSNRSISRESNKLNIYPVPAKDYFYLDLAADATNSELQIVDIVGKTVHSCVVYQQKSPIDISHLNSGIYFVQISHDQSRYVKQLVVE